MPGFITPRFFPAGLARILKELNMKSLTLFAPAAVLFCAAAAAPAAAEGSSPGGATPTVVIGEAAAKTITRSGVLTIKAVLTTNSSLPTGTTVSVSGYASAYDGSFSNSHSVSGQTKVAGGKATIVLRMPYTFLVATTATKVSVNLYASASPAPTATGPRLSYSSSFSSTIALPANNAATTVSFTGAL